MSSGDNFSEDIFSTSRDSSNLLNYSFGLDAPQSSSEFSSANKSEKGISSDNLSASREEVNLGNIGHSSSLASLNKGLSSGLSSQAISPSNCGNMVKGEVKEEASLSKDIPRICVDRSQKQVSTIAKEAVQGVVGTKVISAFLRGFVRYSDEKVKNLSAMIAEARCILNVQKQVAETIDSNKVKEKFTKRMDNMEELLKLAKQMRQESKFLVERFNSKHSSEHGNGQCSNKDSDLSKWVENIDEILNRYRDFHGFYKDLVEWWKNNGKFALENEKLLYTDKLGNAIFSANPFSLNFDVSYIVKYLDGELNSERNILDNTVAIDYYLLGIIEACSLKTNILANNVSKIRRLLTQDRDNHNNCNVDSNLLSKLNDLENLSKNFRELGKDSQKKLNSYRALSLQLQQQKKEDWLKAVECLRKRYDGADGNYESLKFWYINNDYLSPEDFSANLPRTLRPRNFPRTRFLSESNVNGCDGREYNFYIFTLKAKKSIIFYATLFMVLFCPPMGIIGLICYFLEQKYLFLGDTINAYKYREFVFSMLVWGGMSGAILWSRWLFGCDLLEFID